MARLNTTVHVYDAGDTVVYLPGQEVLPQHRAQITAPGVWEDEPDTGLVDVFASAGVEPKDIPAAVVAVEKFNIPPKAGKGSTVAVWRQYATDAAEAAGLRIEIPEDAKRDEIIDALTDANIPTE